MKKHNETKQMLFEMMEKINTGYQRPDTVQFITETYTPSRETRNIIPQDVSDEEVEKADEILKQNVDPSWDKTKFGFMVIGVTGKHQVYYTFWKYSPLNMLNQLAYMGNLATNIVKAAEKAKKIAGIQPIFFDNYETLKSLSGAPSDVIGFGKYRGKRLGEVYAEDPQYVIWIAKNFQAKNAKQKEFHDIARDFTNTFFKSMGDTNREAETKTFETPVGDVFQGQVTVLKIKKYVSDYTGDDTFSIDSENDSERFRFYLSPTALSRYFGLNYSEINPNDLQNKTVTIKGRVKKHREIVGKKYTILSRVSIN